MTHESGFKGAYTSPRVQPFLHKARPGHLEAWAWQLQEVAGWPQLSESSRKVTTATRLAKSQGRTTTARSPCRADSQMSGRWHAMAPSPLGFCSSPGSPLSSSLATVPVFCIAVISHASPLDSCSRFRRDHLHSRQRWGGADSSLILCWCEKLTQITCGE